MIGNTDGYTCATDARFDVDEKNLSFEMDMNEEALYMYIYI